MILDGTVIRIQRNRADRPYYSGKRRHHGMNFQAIASAGGELLSPRALHQRLTAAQRQDIVEAFADGVPQQALATKYGISVPGRSGHSL